MNRPVTTLRTRPIVAFVVVLAGAACSAARSAGPEPAATPPAKPPEAASQAPAAPPPPVEWLDWSPEVFHRARKEGKPVLLTIVSRWCRQCATADKEVYTDPIVRRLIADRWLAVRVDRDERPDIDQRYQLALTAFTHGKSGYPVTAFLFPSGEAMWANLSRPAEDVADRPGMRSLLVRMDEFWHQRFKEAQKNAQFIEGYFFEETKARREQVAPSAFLTAIVDGIVATADHDNGGYGATPRIANPLDVQLVLLASFRREDPGLQEQALKALRAASNGALMDHLDGGFHRAPLDPGWTSPVFGKPLSINAEYLDALVEAVRLTSDPDLAAAAGRTVDYLLGTLESRESGYFAAQAAAAGNEEDASYFSWPLEEVKAAIDTKDLSWARALYGLRDEGERDLGLPPRFTLKRRTTIAEAAKAAGVPAQEVEAASGRILKSLAKLRAARKAPPVSDARYVDSSAQAASALIHAGMVLGRQDALASAYRTLDGILAWAPALDRGVPHRIGAPPDQAAGPPPLMADTAALGRALIDAWQASGDDRYLAAARRAGTAMQNLFLDAELGGFFDIPAQLDPIGYQKFRRLPLTDGAAPAAEATAVIFMEQLAEATSDEGWRRGLGAALAWGGTRLQSLDERTASLGMAFDAFITPAVKISVIGRGAAADGLAAAAWKLYEPSRLVERRGAGDPASATVCVGASCKEGIKDGSDFARIVADLRNAAADNARGFVAAP